MARYDTAHFYKSVELLNGLFDQFPDVKAYGNLNLMHHLMFLKTVAFHRALGDFNQFDDTIKSLGKHLLEEDPQNPYLNYYLGSFYQEKEEKELAMHYFNRIVDAENFSRFWYTEEAEHNLEILRGQ